MITQYSDLLLNLIKGAFMVAGFFTTAFMVAGVFITAFIGLLIILIPFLLTTFLFTWLDNGTPPED